jgi:Fic-DOC domain mobile mystery protein B
MALTGAHAPGATPLDQDDVLGLKLPATTHGELNELEAENILAGWRWASRSTKSRMPNMLTDTYVRELHRRMFGEVWEWAGQYRQRELNIGVAPIQVGPSLMVALGNAQVWLAQETFEPVDFAIRLHHAIVKIHPFRNGNGRHSRLFADLTLVKHFKENRLPWGGDTLGRTDPRRNEYLKAVRAADDGDYRPLLTFCRSS